AIAASQLHQCPARVFAWHSAERECELITHAKVGVVGHADELGADLRRSPERLRQTEPMLANAGVRVVETAQNYRDLECVQPLGSLQAMHRAKGCLPSAGECRERGHGRAILPLVEQARGCVAVPAALVLQKRDELGSRGLAQPGWSRTFETIGHD